MHDQLAAVAAARTPGPSLPSQRTGDTLVPADHRPGAARVLIVDSDRRNVQALADSLPGDFTVIIVTSMEQAGMVPAGDLAIVSLHLGTAAHSMIEALRRRGWLRILALVAPADHEAAHPVLTTGATGLVIGREHDQSARHPRTAGPDLSDREIEVVGMVADGRPNKWIGEQLGLSSLTVKSHLARIGRKFGTGDRAQIVHLALQAGVIQ